MRSLTEVDKVPLTGLPVLGGNTLMFLNSYFEMSLGLTNVGGCAVFSRKFMIQT